MALPTVANARNTGTSQSNRGFTPVNVQVQPANKRAERSQRVQQAQKAQQSNRGYQAGNRQIERSNRSFQQSNSQSRSSDERLYQPTGQKSSKSRSESPLSEVRRLSKPSSPSNASSSLAPLPSAQSASQFPNAQRAPRIPTPRSVAPTPIRTINLNSGLGMGLAESVATSFALDYVNSNGRPNFPGYNPGGSFVEEVGKDLGNVFNGLGNLARNAGGGLKNLFDSIPDPFKKYPRTDPKNDDLRPPPTRYTYDWRGLKFYSPNNRRDVSISAPFGQYSLSDFGEFEERPYAIITWDNLIADGNGGYYIQRGNTGCDPGTIEPDPTYIPPSYELPVLSQPDGTIPDVSGYPPIFTADDFKPQRDLNDDRARDDEQQRQDSPAPEQQTEEALDRQLKPAPDPWNDPFPQPQPFPYPYPYPLDFPSLDPIESPTDFPFPDPTAPPSERLQEKIERLKRKLDERFPAPSNEPRTEVTINGKPVPRPNSSPPQRITEPLNSDEPYVTINGSPVPRTSKSPLPDTRTQTTTQTTTTTDTKTTTTTPKLPVKPIIDPETGLPQPSDDPTINTNTPDKCKDPCIQKLSDKFDNQSRLETIEFKMFDSCNSDTKEAIYKTGSISVPAIAASVIKVALDKIAESQGKECENDCECYAAIPDWWQIRLGADIPQAVVQYAEIKEGNKFGAPMYSVSIPHYSKSEEATKASDFPTYTKGQRMGILTLRDNSKLIVNASSSDVERVIKQLESLISPLWISDAIYSDGKRKGTALKSIQVAPRIVKYFPNGQKDQKPGWIKYF